MNVDRNLHKIICGYFDTRDYRYRNTVHRTKDPDLTQELSTSIYCNHGTAIV